MFETLSIQDKEVSSRHYNLKLRDLLEESAALFAEKGYHHTSIRDIARKMNTSLAGLYYYFKTKEELLFLISKYSFESVVNSFQEKRIDSQLPADQLRTLVQNHLQYFVTHLNAMKVLAHETDSLTGEYFEIVNEKKKKYLETLERILLDVQREQTGQPQLRMNPGVKIAALSLFGMMNWTYTWYNPQKREHSASNIARIADQMVQLFLNGFLHLN